jgi:hypothetical protein
MTAHGNALQSKFTVVKTATGFKLIAIGVGYTVDAYGDVPPGWDLTEFRLLRCARLLTLRQWMGYFDAGMGSLNFEGVTFEFSNHESANPPFMRLPAGIQTAFHWVNGKYKEDVKNAEEFVNLLQRFRADRAQDHVHGEDF